MALFTNTQLAKWLHYEVEADEAVMVEQVVAGWLCEAAGLDELPDPLPRAFFSWALELGGIAFENPTSMTEDAAGDVSSTWSDRRQQILTAVAAWALRNGTGTGAPPHARGNFPPAQPWPQPWPDRRRRGW